MITQQMTIQPLLTCCLAFAYAAFFEVMHTSIHSRWTTPLKKGPWACLYWFFIVLVMGLCGVVPYQPLDAVAWIPFGMVLLFHIPMVWKGTGFARI